MKQGGEMKLNSPLGRLIFSTSILGGVDGPFFGCMPILGRKSSNTQKESRTNESHRQ